MENMETQGIINIYKPVGMTSFDVVNRLRRLTSIKRIGHCGTLDPFAEGCLPICLGRATAAVRFMDGYDKSYSATLVLGASTDSGDYTGRLTVADSRIAEKWSTWQAADGEAILRAVANLTGEQMQVPPMYSAVKVNGRPLYKAARQGLDIPRSARKINVYAAALADYGLTSIPDLPDKIGAAELNFKVADGPEAAEWPWLRLNLDVSKGTYVRAWAEQLAEALGTCGHLIALERTRCGPFTSADAVRLVDLTAENWQNFLLPSETAIQTFPRLDLDYRQGEDLINGKHLPVAWLSAEQQAILRQIRVRSKEAASLQGSGADICGETAGGSEFVAMFYKDCFLGMGFPAEEKPQSYHRGLAATQATIKVLCPERIFIAREDYRN